MVTYQPLVSVIMPTYNHGQYIAEAIASVLEQTYANIELIIVDNYSQDDTESVVNAFQDSRISYYKFANNGVIAASRNYGVSKAKGDVIAFLDSDDIWVKYKLERQLPHLMEDAVIAVASNFTPIGDIQYCFNHLNNSLKGQDRDFSCKEIIISNPVMNSSLILRKQDFITAGGFDERQEFVCIEDWDLWLTISRINKIRVLNEQLLQYRIFANKNRDATKICLNKIELLNKHFNLGSLSNSLYKAAVNSCYIEIGLAYLKKNKYSGIKYLLKGLVFSNYLSNKLKALIGLFLYCMPDICRRHIVGCLYRLRGYNN